MNKIPLFWWDERKFLHKDYENYGDMLSVYLVQKISRMGVQFVHPKKQPWLKRNKKHYVVIGSILQHATKHSIVWGSGIISKEYPIDPADFRAVRGPQTRNHLLRIGYNCPEIYGDPALLLPNYFNPKIPRKYEIGIIPHYNDFKDVSERYRDVAGIKVINMMTLNVEKTTSEILECEKIISSSLHGVIIPHSYGIPALWVEFSDRIFGDGIKYKDYYESVGICNFKAPYITQKLSLIKLKALFKERAVIPEVGKIAKLQKDLMAVCPFK
jgi:pyruvyltransferase